MFTLENLETSIVIGTVIISFDKCKSVRPALAVVTKNYRRLERTCEANPVGENSSVISTVSVKSVSLYHFKPAYVVLPMAVKEFFETHFLKRGTRLFYS